MVGTVRRGSARCACYTRIWPGRCPTAGRYGQSFQSLSTSRSCSPIARRGRSYQCPVLEELTNTRTRGTFAPTKRLRVLSTQQGRGSVSQKAAGCNPRLSFLRPTDPRCLSSPRSTARLAKAANPEECCHALLPENRCQALRVNYFSYPPYPWTSQSLTTSAGSSASLSDSAGSSFFLILAVITSTGATNAGCPRRLMDVCRYSRQ